MILIKKERIYKINKEYWPNISEEKITCDYSGIRTKVKNNDFIIQDSSTHNIKDLLIYLEWIRQITSSMPIGEYVKNRKFEIKL